MRQQGISAVFQATRDQVRGFAGRRPLLLVIPIVSLLLIGLFSQVVLQNFPNTADEYAMVFQARNFADGKIYAAIHPAADNGFRLQHHFSIVHIGERDGKYFGRYFPGYSLMLVPAVILQNLLSIDLSWLVNAILGALTVVLIISIANRYFDATTAWIAGLFAVINGWFLFNSASFFSHASCTLFIGFSLHYFLAAVHHVQLAPRRRNFVLCGLTFGVAVLIRYLDPWCLVVPLGILYITHGRPSGEAGEGRWWVRDMASIATGGVACLIFLLAYNRALTGDMFLTSYTYATPGGAESRMVFFNPDGPPAIELGRIWEIGWKLRRAPDVALLNPWFPYVWFAALLPLGLLLRKRAGKPVAIGLCLLLVPISQLIIYTLYGGPTGYQYGPRYLYGAFVPLAIACALGLTLIFRGRLRPAAVVGALILSAYAGFTTYGLARDFQRWTFERRNLYRTVEQSDLAHAVVLITTPSSDMHPVDLARNAIDFSDDVLYARGLKGHYSDLIRYYPERAFYEYSYQGVGQLGRLSSLLTAPDGRFRRSEDERWVKTVAPDSGNGPGPTP